MITRIKFFTDSPSVSSAAMLGAFRAACSPFGSLHYTDADTASVDDIYHAIKAWIDACYASTTPDYSLVGEIVRCVRAASKVGDADHACDVRISDWGVTLHTPTSGTEIRVSRSWIVVDFGRQGSRSRAMRILDMTEHNGVIPYPWMHGDLRLQIRRGGDECQVIPSSPYGEDYGGALPRQ